MTAFSFNTLLYCTVLYSQYVTDAGSYSDLLNISMAAKEQGGRKSEGDGVQGVHLSQQSYMRKSLIT